MRQLGIPVYLDAGNHLNLNHQPLWYSGILTIFKLEHTLRTELGGKKDLQEAKTKFSAARQQLLAQGGGAVHIYYHPCEWVHQEFWDGVNFRDGANPAPQEWKLPPQKTPKQTQVAFQIFQEYLRWMKRQPGVRFLTARDALVRYSDKARGHAFTLDEIEEIAAAVKDTISFQRRRSLSLSPAEIFALLNARLATHVDTGSSQAVFTLTDVPFGPTEASPQLDQPHTVTWSQFQRTAQDVAGYLQQHGRIPSTVWLGSTGVPPEAYLAALARVVPQLKGANTLQPVVIQPATLATAKYVAEDSPTLWGWLFPTGWHAPTLMQLAKRQAWTIKPAIRHEQQ
jgi:hypothetical protein